MENTTNELVKLFRERLRYPIITVYGVILIIYNWDVLSIFFLSNKLIEDRIIYINTVFEGETFSRLIYPLLKAIIVSLLAPLVMWLLDISSKKITEGRTKIKNQRVQQALTAKLDTATLEWQIEEAKAGKHSIFEWETKIQTITNSMQKQQEQYQQQIDILERNNDSQKATIKKQLDELQKKNEVIENDKGHQESHKIVVKQYTKIIDHFINTFCSRNNISNDAFSTMIFTFMDPDCNYIKIQDSLKKENITFSIDRIQFICNDFKEWGIINSQNDSMNLTDFGHELVSYFLPF